MSTAIIITGEMRSFERCIKNLEWQVFRHFPDAKFYVAPADDEDASKAELLREKHEHVWIKPVTQPEMVMPPGCPTTWTPGQFYMHEPYHISVPPTAVIGQLWSLREGWHLYESANDPADVIIRCRPDLWFHNFVMPGGLYTEGTALVAYTPWWGRFGGINDRFAIMGKYAASSYFNTYTKLPYLIEYGCPLHPESLVKTSLEAGGNYVSADLLAEFSTLRKNGEMRMPEITAIDRHHHLRS